ncbi:transmembrane protein, putative [Medicago truncatula]|uniref:Transmembrane protein, putative n=1 Tax=Medicago truncatula TaxID=3880 RepID=A0A072V231_MEDTR|nr:transmembrane protein, putative [Medicago truncatula]
MNRTKQRETIEDGNRVPHKHEKRFWRSRNDDEFDKWVLILIVSYMMVVVLILDLIEDDED